MIAIYKGEDTEFAGQEPFLIKINTPLDLTGYTAKLLFGNVVKEFGSEEVGNKLLRLSFTAADTLDFYPGKGYASVKVFDTEGRVAVLKRFVIDVRFRRPEDSAATLADVEETIHAFDNLRKAAETIAPLTEDDGIDVVRDALNTILSATKERSEFKSISSRTLEHINHKTIKEFLNCIRNLESLANDNSELEEDALEEVRNRLNAILRVFTHKTSSSGIKQLLEWAREINRTLRTQQI